MILRDAAQQALEALEIAQDDCIHGEMAEPSPIFEKAITALRAALGEPQPEPVAWMYRGIRHDGTLHENESLIWRPEYMDIMSEEQGAKATPLYAHPPQRQPLSDEEISRLWSWSMTAEAERTANTQQHAFARAIERAHGIGGAT